LAIVLGTIGHWIGNSLVIGLGTIGHWIGNSLIIGLGTSGHWIGNSLVIGLGTLWIGNVFVVRKQVQEKSIELICCWIGELVDFGRYHVHQSQWDTICQGSGRCGWMKL